MPLISSEKQSFSDPLEPEYYDQVIIAQTEWSSIAGEGTPEDGSDVTGDHIFLTSSAPTEKESNAREGDIWYDANDTNHPYKRINGVWVSIRDTGAATGPSVGQFVNSIAFTPTDFDTLEWGAGGITLNDGTTYTISSGNTGAMSAITYIFLDIVVSTTVLQTTTTATNAVGANRLLVAVAKPNADTAKDAEFQIFGGFGQSTFITADNVAANTLTANEIAANTITANEMNVSTLSAISADLGTITAGTITGGTFQTSAVADTGIKFDATSLRGYAANGTTSFELDPATGGLTAQNISYSPNQMFALFQVGITELPGVGTCMSMTRHGRYILVPYDAGAGVYQWRIWDAGEEYIYNYTRNPSITVTPLTILPRVSCVVLDGTTEYILGFAFGGTTCYRYDDDGNNEAAVSFSGTAIVTGAYRIGYDKAQGYVYIMDDSSEGGTTVKRYTFAGTTLTYVDTITLSVAPAAGGPLNMWIGNTYLIMGDAYTNASRVDYQRYAKNTGVQAAQVEWGHGTTGVNFVSHMIRMDDNGFLFCTENDNGTGTTSLIMKIFLE